MKKWEYVLFAPIAIAGLAVLTFVGWMFYLLALGFYDVFVIRFGFPLWGLISCGIFMIWLVISVAYFGNRHFGWFEEGNL
ncbi:hypothetical protein [Brevibacillus reuszeri]|uniref:hypothetical protein n=1 Tax=Brevibacillus reuszeri TaxID=54915 RepID=UPI000CCC69F0|nr:hypothetical protein [Brevibacillus reuszeri]